MHGDVHTIEASLSKTTEEINGLPVTMDCVASSVNAQQVEWHFHSISLSKQKMWLIH